MISEGEIGNRITMRMTMTTAIMTTRMMTMMAVLVVADIQRAFNVAFANWNIKSRL